MTKFNNDNTTMVGYRVFETLKFLIENPASVTEIIKYLESLDTNSGKIYSKGVIYKYIATLKFAGINIGRNKCKYEIKNLPFKIPFDEDNLNALLTIENIIEQLPEKNLTKEIKDLLYALKIRYSIDAAQIKKSNNSFRPVKLDIPTDSQMKILEYYEKLCSDKQKINLEYLDLYGKKCKINCEPIEVKFENSQIYLKSYCEIINEFVELNSNQIINILQLPSKCTAAQKYNFANTTVFCLSGKLAKRYKPRNNEILTQDGEKITVMNKEEAKNVLLLRLMRYGKNCEIKSTKNERHKMREVIEKTLSNYNISV